MRFQERHRKIVEAAARRAARRHRLRPDDALAEANYEFVLAARAFDGRGDFDAFLRWRLARRLGEGPRTAARREGLLPRRADGGLESDPPRAPPPSPLDSLSDDADAVVRLAVASRPGLRAGQIRKMVRDYLSAVGWTAKQIADTFQEIREALQ